MRHPLRALLVPMAAALLLAACDDEDGPCSPEPVTVHDLCTDADFAAGQDLELLAVIEPPENACASISCTATRDVTQLYLTIEHDGCDPGPGELEHCSRPSSIVCELGALDPALYFVTVNDEPFGSITVRDGGTETECH